MKLNNMIDHQIHIDNIYWGNSLKDYLIALGIIFGVALTGHLIKVFLLRSLNKWAVKSETKRSEEHKSELQSLMRISYAVFCLKKKKKKNNAHKTLYITIK